MTRILIVQTAFLGDVVLTTPLFRELRRAHPNAEIDLVTTPLGAEALEGFPHLTGIIPYDKRRTHRGPLGFLRLIRRLRRGGYNLAIAAQRSFRTGLLVRLSQAPVRIGYEKAAGSWGYTQTVPWLSNDHAVHRYLALAGSAGGDPAQADPQPELAVLPGAWERVKITLKKLGVNGEADLVAMAPGSVWGTKRWKPSGFGEVAGDLARRGFTVVLIGSGAERELCQSVAAMADGPPVVLAGLTSVPEMSALLAHCRALLTNDSGPAHIASAVGTPAVTLFGPTVPAFGYTAYGSRNRIVEHPDLSCRPCHHHGPAVCPLRHHNCMQEIPAGQVLSVLLGVLEPGRIAQLREEERRGGL